METDSLVGFPITCVDDTGARATKITVIIIQKMANLSHFLNTKSETKNKNKEINMNEIEFKNRGSATVFLKLLKMQLDVEISHKLYLYG